MADQLASKRALLSRVRRVVIKIGSSILSGPSGLDRQRITDLVGEIAALRQRPYQIVLVSSGAVAAGTTRLGLRGRPKTVPARQAAAAVGQIHLMALYDERFVTFGEDDVYEQADAAGFIRLFGLSQRVRALKDQELVAQGKLEPAPANSALEIA